MKKSLVIITIALFAIISIVLFLLNSTYPATKSLIIVDSEIKFSRVINLNGVDYCNGDLCLGKGAFSVFVIASDEDLIVYYYAKDNYKKEFSVTSTQGSRPIFSIKNDTLIKIGEIQRTVTVIEGWDEQQCDIFTYLALSYGLKEPECKTIDETIFWY